MKSVYLSIFLLFSLLTFSQKRNELSFNSDSLMLKLPSTYPWFSKFVPYNLQNELSVLFKKNSKENVLNVSQFKFENSIENSGNQLNTVLGGRYRSNLIKKNFFYDLDWQPGYRKYKYKYIRYPNGGFEYIPDGKEFPANISLEISMNYKVYKDIYFGAGVEPKYSYTLDFKPKSDITGKPNGGNMKFSMPVLYRIGTDFKKTDMSISHKIDFNNKSKSDFQFKLLAPLK
jgi:hypothetical protein